MFLLRNIARLCQLSLNYQLMPSYSSTEFSDGLELTLVQVCFDSNIKLIIFRYWLGQ